MLPDVVGGAQAEGAQQVEGAVARRGVPGFWLGFWPGRLCFFVVEPPQNLLELGILG